MCTVNSHTVPKLICISAYKIPAVKARFLCRDSDCFGTVFVVTDALFALSCKMMADCIEEL